MDASEQIRSFTEFIELNYLPQLMKLAAEGAHSLIVDFSILSRYSPELATELLENPEDVIKAAELSIDNFDLPNEVKDFRVRFKNLPESQFLMIRNIRSEHIGKLIYTQGVVRQKSDVRPQVTTARFECPSCGNIMTVVQTGSKFREPSRCVCGRKGKFRLLGKELVDVQRIVLEESPDEIEGADQPKRINVFLKQDLVSPLSERKSSPGSKIRITGIVREVPITLHTGAQSTRYDLMIDANYEERIEEDYSDIEITKEEEEEIIKLSKDPMIIEKLSLSLVPGIYGYEKVKEALLLQMAGGVKKSKADGVDIRGDIHILLVGDPGAGKSQMLKRISKVAPKARYVGGKGISAAGLTATVVKDEFLRGWALEAGALVLANKGIVCIDEMDKMSTEDRSAMHEALEQQQISISKANVQATLRAETTVLAAANPKFGRFDPYKVIAEQIDLPPTLINRFDLIFIIRDMPDAEHDKELAEFILRMHKGNSEEEALIKTDIIKKYVAYAKQKIKPRLTDAAIEEIKNYYLKMRSSGIKEGEIPVIPISARQLEALVRMAEASAKIRLSSRVTKKDAKRGINLVHYCLQQVGLDPETGNIDIDRISTGVPASERSKIKVVMEIIEEMEETTKPVPIEQLTREAEVRGLKSDAIDEIIEKLKRHGDIYEPKRGFIQRL